MVLNQACNNLFVVRVAGNVLSSEGLGSLDYAAQQFEQSLKLLVVLGHSGCGAVTAAVDAFLRPTRYLSLAASQPLRAIIDRLFIAVRGAARALRAVHGDAVTGLPVYREALIEMAVVANASLSAFSLRQELAAHRAGRIEVVYGVYDLASHRLVLPGQEKGEIPGFLEPPGNESDFAALGRRTAMSARIRRILDA
jgi:carbonic anhydrase